MKSYVYIDVSKKQEFIFRQNKLIDNLYNSYIIKSVTEKFDTCKINDTNNISSNIEISFLKEYLQNNYLNNFKIVYSGGGNSIVEFNSKDEAEKFIRGYSFEVLKIYPELELYISLVSKEDIEKNNEPVDNIEKEIVNLLIKNCDRLKDSRNGKFKRWSYGIEKIDENGKPKLLFDALNDEIKIKKKSRDFLFDFFEREFDKINNSRQSLYKVVITEELNKYKKADGGKSYIGIISIDGNAMGKMVEKIETFQKRDEFSKIIDKIYKDAVISGIKKYIQKFSLDNKKTNDFFITPIVQSGDDICLIVEAQHSIEVAANIVREIKNISEECNESKDVLKKYFDDTTYLSACAGIAIARYTYPFFEAVKRAEDLCHEAKEKVYSIPQGKKDPNTQNSYITWEVLKTQVIKSEHEQYIKNRNLIEKFHIKPLCIDQNHPNMNNIFGYDMFLRFIRKIKKEQSNSYYEKIKREIYNGIENYKDCIDNCLNNMKNHQNDESQEELFEDENLDKYYLYIENAGNKTSYTYILNDLLEAEPFVCIGGND